MKKNLVYLFLFTYFYSLPFLMAQEVLDVNYVSKIKITDKVPGRDDLQQNAIENVSLDNIRLLIGAAKTERNLKQIKEKIISNSSRYILSLQGGAVARKGAEVSLPIDMRFSLKNLRAVLLEEGLLYQIDGAPKVLPLIQVGDYVGSRQFGWWVTPTTSNEDLSDISLKIENWLKLELSKINFIGTTPQSSGLMTSVPAPFKTLSLQKSDAQSFGEKLKNQVIVRGEVSIRSKSASDSLFIIEIKAEALQSANGRVMGEVVRSFETDAGTYKAAVAKKLNQVGEKVIADLVAQIAEVWKSGAFGSTQLKLTVLGSLSPKEIDQLKRMFPLQIRDIKNIKERRFEARSTTFEIDSTAVPQQLAQSLKGARFEPFKLSIKEVMGDEVIVEATR